MRFSFQADITRAGRNFETLKMDKRIPFANCAYLRLSGRNWQYLVSATCGMTLDVRLGGRVKGENPHGSRPVTSSPIHSITCVTPMLRSSMYSDHPTIGLPCNEQRYESHNRTQCTQYSKVDESIQECMWPYTEHHYVARVSAGEDFLNTTFFPRTSAVVPFVDILTRLDVGDSSSRSVCVDAGTMVSGCDCISRRFESGKYQVT